MTFIKFLVDGWALNLNTKIDLAYYHTTMPIVGLINNLLFI